MKCTSNSFGTTKKGEEVNAYTMTNEQGSSVTVLSYGGIIQSLKVPDRDGKLGNVVLGFNTIEAYEEKSPYFGCITGRVAGRISGAAFEIDGESFQLAANENNNTLHGGRVGLDKRVWEVSEKMNETSCQLFLSYTSPHMEENFPGTLDMVVTYEFDEDNCLKISYKATTDAPTIVTLTNHSYFNLAGNASISIENHKMTIPADQVMALGEDAIPTGLDDVEGTSFDFRQAKAIGQDIEAGEKNLKNGGGYDHPFLLNKEEGEKIVLESPETGRVMTMETTEAAVVCYTANFLEPEVPVYDNQPVVARGAVCLETQYYPDAINQTCVPTKILRPGEVYREWTSFRFTAGA